MKTLTSITLIALMFFGNHLKADPLNLGAKLPSVNATLDSGQKINLSTETPKGYLLVYFYPKADTPGCTKQACSLRDAYQTLVEKGVTVLGVSKDNPKSQQSFKEKYSLPFQLIADTDSEVINAFGVPTKLGFASRQAFLFKDGALVWRDLAASTSKQADDILDFLNLSSTSNN